MEDKNMKNFIKEAIADYMEFMGKYGQFIIR